MKSVLAYKVLCLSSFLRGLRGQLGPPTAELDVAPAKGPALAFVAMNNQLPADITSAQLYFQGCITSGCLIAPSVLFVLL